MSNKVTRLYKSFQPSKYNLDLKLAPETDKFYGVVEIVGKKVGRPSKRLTLHQSNLKILSVEVISHGKQGAKPLKVVRFNNQQTFNELRIHFNQLVYPGDYSLKISYQADITRPMNGIYPCFFEDDGVEKKIIATQFESHHAREAFPCIDEPEAKAVFNLSLDTPKYSCIISNTEVVKQTKLKSRVKTVFAQTPKMSTYLLAFVAGEMDFLEAKTEAGTVVRTYATKDNLKHTKFALDCALKTLDFYNEYFDIPYPLTKCDFVALPDFASGAMENWGCITFREQALLVDKDNTSLSLKQFVASVVAHELTHQWFGNLVTMRWWTDLWLNESFASWMSYLAVDHIFPDWKVWTQFTVDEQGIALKLDALEHSHPIEVEVRHPDEIRTIFDAISYEKGASVISMLENYLGPTPFRDGIRLYLKAHMYGNTDTVDLWDALEKASKRPVKEFMSRWTTLTGYPILKVVYSDGAVSLTQERFYLNPSVTKDGSIWPIPLLNEQISKDFDRLDESGLVIERDSKMPLSLFNQGRNGFYRVIYDLPSLTSIAKSDLKGVSDVDRLGLLSDSFEAAKAGYSATSDSLELLKHYSHESSVVVWEVIAGELGSIRLVMNDDHLRDLIKPYVRKFISVQLKRLTWDEKKDDSHFDKLLRPIILGLAASADEATIVSNCKKLFSQIEANKNPVQADLRSVVYSTVARQGGKKEFDKLVKLHKATSSPEEKLNLCAALTGFKQEDLIKKSLGLIKSDQVRIQDVAYWVSYSFMNHHSRDQAWAWLKENWDWMQQNMGTDLSFSRMPLYVGRCYSDLSFLKEFTDFFDQNLSPAFDRPLNQAIETINWQSAWKSRDKENIVQFFSK
ncbi:MAG TPA: M1 family metallopeptidase [Candidatus Saccharimonadales bacterium]